MAVKFENLQTSEHDEGSKVNAAEEKKKKAASGPLLQYISHKPALTK